MQNTPSPPVSPIAKITHSLPHGEMEKLYALNILYSVLMAAMAVVVPLYLLHLKVDITYIGIIVALNPLVFMIMRVFFASIADSIGTRSINAISSITNLMAISLYIAMSTPIGFALGGFFEGMRASAFWSVVRTDILFVKGHAKASTMLARFSGLRQFADGAGRFIVGFSLVYMSFQGTLMAIAALSVLLLIISLSIGHSNGHPSKTPIKDGIIPRILKKRPLSFWQASFLLMLIFIVINTLVSFMIPVYLTEGLGLSYEETGTYLALFSLATAFATLLPLRFEINPHILILFAALMVPALIALPLTGTSIMIPILVLALGSGACNILNEYIIVDQVFRSKDVSTDIGVLFIPLKLGEFMFLVAAGFVVTRLGYLPLFITQSLFMAVAVLFIWLMFRRSGR